MKMPENQKEENNHWKNSYFKQNPGADTNQDGVLSWPEMLMKKE